MRSSIHIVLAVLECLAVSSLAQTPAGSPPPAVFSPQPTKALWSPEELLAYLKSKTDDPWPTSCPVSQCNEMTDDCGHHWGE
ncbi:hypothetical protein GMORB2_6495 [Geosmithia morbida]|uniref:Secreted protein n=1 Tax=Geosmithia morbida TaxID=1094350 RepID=A0A9P4YW83_9HYPO|nr:uncharacterized protein GMORB2_6495 [Geosmithia morbida]KAF4122947.1 hypothetical protein GMORB2_6495 [Geosmithia morbida]